MPYNDKDLKLISKKMWNNYGRIFADIFLREFRKENFNQILKLKPGNFK